MITPTTLLLNSPTCGKCGVSLETSEAFFSHWLTHHCQPHGPANDKNNDSTVSSSTPDFQQALPTAGKKRRYTEEQAGCGDNPTGPAVGGRKCVCGICQTQVRSITSFLLHWVQQHQKVCNTSYTALNFNELVPPFNFS